MYACALLLMVGAPLLLGSLWGLAGLVLLLPLLAARALGEEAVLVAGLPGYRGYTAKVRYRLVPGAWCLVPGAWRLVKPGLIAGVPELEI